MKRAAANGYDTPSVRSVKAPRRESFGRAPPPDLGGDPPVGEVRYQTAEDAEAALCMDGTEWKGSMISVELDAGSQDGSKIIVSGLPRGVQWQDLKDYFAQHGNIMFAGVGKPKGAGRGRAGAGGAPKNGEVRFETPEEAENCVESLNGVDMDGFPLSLELDMNSKDMTKVLVNGIPPSAEWQELKDFFLQAGKVCYASVKSGGAPPPRREEFRQPREEFRPREPIRSGRPDGPAMASTGEVRYNQRRDAEIAVDELNGTFLGNSQIWVSLDGSSKDGTRVIVRGLPAGLAWQALKDHFSSIAPVAYSAVKPAEPEPAAPSPRGAYQERGSYGRAEYGRTAAYGGDYGRPAPPSRPEPTKLIGEIRFADPESSQIAFDTLDGQFLKGSRITIKADRTSSDGTKVLVMGLSENCGWQDLKDFMAAAGGVAYAKVTNISGGGGGKGGKGGGKDYGPPPSHRREPAPPPGAVGEVRFVDPEDSHAAVRRFNGTTQSGQRLRVEINPSSHDGAKIQVFGLKPGFKWQDMKDLFMQVGQVAYAKIDGGDAPNGRDDRGAPSKPAKQRERITSAAGSSGEVRYARPEDAASALEQLSNSLIKDSAIQLQTDPRSQDGSKILISNLPAGIEWQEVKDHFVQCGEVVFAGIFGPGEVRMSTTEEAEEAARKFDGTDLDGQIISVQIDPASHDSTRLIVHQLPPTIQWQDLKDHFQSVGTVAYAARKI